MEPQPRQYRIRLFDREREMPVNPPYAAVLDFTPGPGLRATEGQLDALVQALAYAAGARREKVLNFRLIVQDWVTGQQVCSWPAKTWPDSR